jgi:S-adenosylmethionine decarboxylase
MHLIIDGYSNDSNILQDEALLYQLLDSLPTQIGMTKISEPCVFKYVGTNPEDWGVSGFVVIAESHISFHTFVERCYLNFDIFSCRDFDVQATIDYIRNIFQLNKLKSYLVNRDWNPSDLSEDNIVESLSAK